MGKYPLQPRPSCQPALLQGQLSPATSDQLDWQAAWLEAFPLLATYPAVNSNDLPTPIRDPGPEPHYLPSVQVPPAGTTQDHEEFWSSPRNHVPTALLQTTLNGVEDQSTSFAYANMAHLFTESPATNMAPAPPANFPLPTIDEGTATYRPESPSFDFFGSPALAPLATPERSPAQSFPQSVNHSFHLSHDDIVSWRGRSSYPQNQPAHTYARIPTIRSNGSGYKHDIPLMASYPPEGGFSKGTPQFVDTDFLLSYFNPYIGIGQEQRTPSPQSSVGSGFSAPLSTPSSSPLVRGDSVDSMTSSSTSMNTPQSMDWPLTPPVTNLDLFRTNEPSTQAPLFPGPQTNGRPKPRKVVPRDELRCRQCTHVSSRKKDVARHELTHAKGLDKEKWNCVCGKGYGRRDNLQRHQRTSCRRRG